MLAKKIKLSAELCCNHMGNIEIAKQMIDTLAKFPKEYKIDIIKFQKRTPELILTPEAFNSPHPDVKNAFGKTYGEHRKFLEFDINQHRLLKEYCEEKGFIYSSSVFDQQSAEEILSLNPQIIKISSANNTDYKLLEYIDNNFNGEIHISLGMTTQEEEEKIVNSIKKNKNNLVLYACTSAYPAQPGNIYLLEVKRLKEKFANSIKAIGFSGHHTGILYDPIAISLGAEYIERHFTLDKTLKGSDQTISLEANEFLELSKNINLIANDLTYKIQEIPECEQKCRSRYKK